MKTRIYLLFLVLLGFALLGFTFFETKNVRHVVVFKYKVSATPAQISEVTNAFRDLKNKIPGIVSFEHGTNISPEKLDKGFNHVYVLTFENAAARDTYLPHPDHKKFGDLLSRIPIVEEVFVVDFVPEQ